MSRVSLRSRSTTFLATAAMLAMAGAAGAQDYQGPTAPSKAPAELNVAVVTCYSILHGCVAPADAIEAVGGELGWNVTVYDGGGSSRLQNAAILDALSAGADVVVTIAIDSNLVQLGLSEAASRGVPVVSGSNGSDTPNPVAPAAEGALGYVFDVSPDYAELGRQTAQWIIEDSGGEANVVVFSDQTFPSVLALQVGLLEGLEACEGCTISEPQYFTAAQVGSSLGPQTVGYVRNNPDTTYLFSPYDPAAADQVTALAQAGMQDVKVVSVLGNQQNIDFIRSGRVQVADAAYDNQYMGYAIVDQIIRMLNEEPLVDPRGENLPLTVLHADNLPEPGADWHADTGYEARFMDLWK